MHRVEKYIWCLETAIKTPLQNPFKKFLKFPRKTLVFESIFSAKVHLYSKKRPLLSSELYLIELNYFSKLVS